MGRHSYLDYSMCQQHYAELGRRRRLNNDVGLDLALGIGIGTYGTGPGRRGRAIITSQSSTSSRFLLAGYQNNASRRFPLW